MIMSGLMGRYGAKHHRSTAIMKMQTRTDTQKRRAKRKAQKASLIKALQNGANEPRFKYFPGIELIYTSFGLIPHVDIFIPEYGRTEQENKYKYVKWQQAGNSIKQVPAIKLVGPVLTKSARQQVRLFRKRLEEYNKDLRLHNLGILPHIPKAPIVMRYFNGMEIIVSAVGLVPNVDVFIPRPDEDPDKMKGRRASWARARRYRLQREANGESYKSQAQRRNDRIQEEFSDELRALSKQVERIATGDVQNLDAAAGFVVIDKVAPQPVVHPAMRELFARNGITIKQGGQ
jgi:hypothetical protein